jgi:hypothetical protein
MSFYDDYPARTPTSGKEAERAQVIKEQAGKGILFGLPGTAAMDLAEEIHRRYPVIDLLRFTQPGVEATMYGCSGLDSFFSLR